MSDDEPSAGARDVAEQTLRQIKETHEAALRTHAMVLDIYNIVVYGVMPPTPAVPPHPKGTKLKKKGAVDPIDAIDAIGRLVGRFRGR